MDPITLILLLGAGVLYLDSRDKAKSTSNRAQGKSGLTYSVIRFPPNLVMVTAPSGSTLTFREQDGKRSEVTSAANPLAADPGASVNIIRSDWL